MNQRRLRCLLPILMLLAAGPSKSDPGQKAIREWQSHKYGMFIHFGLYSVLGGVWKGKQYSGNYSEQIQSDAQIPGAEYARLASQFDPEKWNPEEIVQLAQDAGMKFIVLTSKHHDGFSLFQTRASNYNVVDASPYKRDIVKSLADACARHHMPFGVYYSTIDWHWGDTPSRPNDNPISAAHEEFNVQQLKELMSGYGPISEIWFDMGHPTQPQSKHFADAVHTLQPDCMVSGRVWNEQGDFMEMGDDQIPEYILDEPWEAPASIYQSTWGYRSWQERTGLQKKTEEHIQRLVSVVSRGGNYILNIGPQGDGSVVGFEADVLRGVGSWLKRNGEAIYDTQPQPFRKLDFGYATVQGNRLFLFVEHPAADGHLKLPGLQNHIRKAYLLGDAGQKPLAVSDGQVDFPASAAKNFLPVVAVELEGKPEVMQPAVLAGADGAVVLTPEMADRFYNTNGEGYYDPPTLRKEQWHFAATRPGAYKIQIGYKPGKFAQLLDVTVAGKVFKTGVYGEQSGPANAGTIELTESKDVTLTVNPALPAEKGAKLQMEIDRISLTPLQR